MATSVLTEASEKKNIGQLLYEDGYISKEQYDKAQRVYAKLEVSRRFSDVLVNLGYVSLSQIKDVLRTHKESVQIGDYLVEMNIISERQLEKALKLQEADGGRLGEILLEMGAVTEPAFYKSLSELLDCPFIEPDLRAVDRKCLQNLSVKFMKKYLFL